MWFTRIRVLASRMRSLLTARRRDAELSDEIQTHLDALTDEYVRSGMHLDRARSAARRDFGGIDQMKETHRDQRTWSFIDSLVRDTRYAVRGLRRSPGFTTVVIVTLALGIGANTAIFSLINAVLFKPLPVKHGERLAAFTIASPSGSRDDSFSYPLYEQLRDGSQLLSGITASGGLSNIRFAVGGAAAGESEIVIGEKVTGNFFSVLEVEPVLGRTFTAEDDRADRSPSAVVISHAFWQRRFGSDPAIVGRTVSLNDVPFTIVGVMTPGFFGFEVGRNPDLWWPLLLMPRVQPAGLALLSQPESTWLRLMGRLASGASLPRAQVEVDLMFQRDLAERARIRDERLGSRWTPTERRTFFERSIALQPGRTGYTRLRAEFTQPLVVLMVIVGIVLLIGCANIANLLLARAGARRREIAVRLAMGAGRGRLVQQFLTESLTLAIAGAVAGLFVARSGAQLLLTYFPPQRLAIGLAPDVRVAGFTIAVSVFTAVLFGLMPALRATRLDVASGVRAAAGGSTSDRSLVSLNRLLVIGQVALSVFLLIAAGLFVRTLVNLQRIDVGFERASVVMFALDVPSRYTAAETSGIYERVVARLQELPGVRSTSVARFGLLRDDNWTNKVTVPGYVPAPDENTVSYGQIVGERYFATMGIPLVEGREFTASEVGAALQTAANPWDVTAVRRRAAVVNRVMARRFFGGGSAVGRTFSLRPNEPMEIVGVAEDAKYRSVREEPLPTFYVPGGGSIGANILVRTSGQAASLRSSIARTIHEIDPSAHVLRTRTMDEVVDETLLRERFVGRLAGVFSVIGLMLAAVGLYGVMSYVIARRTREIAIRMALGARRAQVIWIVLRGDAVLVAIGFAVGVPAALASARAVEHLFFGVRAVDPATVAAAILTMAIVGAIAGWIPARRASLVDPMVALRHDS